MPISSSGPLQRGVAIAKDVAAASANWDDGQYAMFKEAVSYASLAISDPKNEFFDAASILVLFMNVALILVFDRKSERYYVASVIFGEDRSPDPGGISSFIVTEEPLLVEDVLHMLNFDSQALLIDQVHEDVLGDEHGQADAEHDLFVDRRPPAPPSKLDRRQPIGRFLKMLVTRGGAVGHPCETSPAPESRSGPKGRRFVVKSLDRADLVMGVIVLDVAPSDRCERPANPTTS